MLLKERNLHIRILAIVLLIGNSIFAQTYSESITWIDYQATSSSSEVSTTVIKSPFKCLECIERIVDKTFIVPYFTKSIKAENFDLISVRLENAITKTSNKSDLHKYILDDFEITTSETYVRGERYLIVSILPLKKVGNQTTFLESFDISLQTKSRQIQNNNKLRKKKDQTYNSVLETGEFHKVSIVNDGIYKITKSFLSNNGISADDIDLSKFKVYGNGGTMLPELIASPRVEDLKENTTEISDANGNNKLDDEDYILWYAQGPTKFSYDNSTRTFDATGHDFDVAAYYYLNWDGKTNKKITSLPNGQGGNVHATIDEYDHLIYHESNEENHIKSGRRWWGDKMQIQTVKSFDYEVPGTVVGRDIGLHTITTARSFSGVSLMQINLAGTQAASISYASVPGPYDEDYADSPRLLRTGVSATSSSLQLIYQYSKTQNDASAWIDYFVLTVPRALAIYDNQQIIRTHRNQVSGDVRYNISGYNSSHSLWNITDMHNPVVQNTFADGSLTSFITSYSDAQNPPKYIIFNADMAPAPTYIKKVENQNLHGIDDIDYLIVTNQVLLEQANRLAEFHRDRGLVVEVVTNEQIFNEFSSGSQDVTAIRDFSKLLYDRSLAGNDKYKYILLFGDASYDYKNIEANNTNVVPIYQSYESNFPPHSYCSDDFYAILDNNEGLWSTPFSIKGESLDIAVGRIPASNIDEAKIAVDKIVHYHSKSSRGNWVQTLTFIADDENRNQHVAPSESMTKILELQNPEYNIKKIWLDAYEQVSFGSGNKYPSVNEEITKMIDSKGTLIFNYVGHGGENGMAHERVVTRPEIINWSNYDKLSFFITASCELAKIDNLEIESPGELMLFDPNGGAIGLLATTRVVYIGVNTNLNNRLMSSNLFKQTNGLPPTLGQAYAQTRNSGLGELANARCFILLGDPAMRLLTPEYDVVTTKINGIDIGLFTDTLKALSLVTIEGNIRDRSGSILTDFNGELYPTFFDKPSTYKTLGQDAASFPLEFEQQNRIIYTGKVSVNDGKFSFQFVVPRDIAYNVGEGKLSYYAKDGLDHAGGTENTYNIGGTSSEVKDDQKFDNLEMYINDESWVFGGTTGTSPSLYATLQDSSGINTIGSGIGRAMEALLDEGTPNEKSILLNDFYESELNSYQKGKITYPFDELEIGKHTLTLKVWDVYNNSAKAYTEFIVTSDEDILVDNVLNYPNPFTSSTEFHFDHNKAGQNIRAKVSISSVTGKIVKNIVQEIPNAPTHCSSILWDGRDEYGDSIGRGVYLYTLTVQAEDGTSHTKTEKLYIIN